MTTWFDIVIYRNIPNVGTHIKHVHLNIKDCKCKQCNCGKTSLVAIELRTEGVVRLYKQTICRLNITRLLSITFGV